MIIYFIKISNLTNTKYMARRNDPFSKRNTKWGTNLISTLIAWSIVAPFAVADSIPNTSYNNDSEPISKTFAIILFIISIILIPVFIPLIEFVLENSLLFPLIVIPVIVWGGAIISLILAFTNIDKKDKKVENISINTDKSIDTRSIYEKIVDAIAKDTIKYKNDRIRKEYYDLVSTNKIIEEKKCNIYQEIDKYKLKLKRFGFIHKYKNKYSAIIKMLSNEISSLENSIKQPIINLNNATTNNSKCVENKDEVYLIIDNNIYPYKTVDFKNLSKSRIEKRSFFKIDITPITSLCFNSIQFYFYDELMLIMSRKNFAIIDYNNISIKTRVILIEPKPSKYSTNFKTTYKKWLHSCLDGTPDLRFSYNYERIIVQATIVDLNIYSQKISLIFNEKENADNFVNNILNHQSFK